jgi:DNA topoisomerase I
MKLIVVESPTKAQTLERFLGKGYRVLATMGHIRDLPKSKLGVDVENDFAPQYEIVPGQDKVLDQIKKASLVASKIYLATDPDREGEAIAYHVFFLISNKGSGRSSQRHFSRITFHEITGSAVESALSRPGEINKNLVEAQTARRVLDRLVGYKLSPVLWKKIRRGLSAGRVQSVTVRLIVEREREINKFSSCKYWRIFGEFLKGKEIFRAELVSYQGKKYEVRERKELFVGDYTSTKTTIGSQKEAEQIIAKFKPPYLVDRVEKRLKNRHPLPPFTTSTMQQAAYRALSFSSRRTMRAAQQLYEKGLITYHRTDSVSLAKEAIENARQVIVKSLGRKYLPDKPNFYRTATRVAQEAHEAIRPTDFSKDKISLGRDVDRLYRLIWQRALASQAADAKIETISAYITSGDYIFIARGRRFIFGGFLKLLGPIRGEEQVLPSLLVGDRLKASRFVFEDAKTLPPPRYSEGSLIAVLEKEGIGRPSTYAPTISVIQSRHYVQKQEGKFVPTALGWTTNDFLVKFFPQIIDLPFTVRMEEDLDEIANGKKEWQRVIEVFYQPFIKKVKKVEKEAKRVKIPVEKTGEVCPKCHKGELVIRTGRFGKFLSCSRFPECDYTAPLIEKVAGVVCPDCGGEVVIRRTRKGRPFYGCINYPKCRWASWRKPEKS